MINVNRVKAMLLRYAYNMRHSFDRLTDMFYWPAMDLLIWGLTGFYFIKSSAEFSSLLFVILSGLIFWLVVWRTQYEITTNMLSEIWDKNIVNIFASPLKISEWIAAFMVFGITKMFISLTFSSILAFVLFKLNVFLYGFYLIPLIVNLILTGWAAGFFVAGFLVRFGNTIQTLAWAGVYLIAPFSAIFYPITILPTWAQKISQFVPSSYVFEGIREILFTGHLSTDKIIASLALNLIYLILSICFFTFMFHKSRKLGLGRLIQ
ncbi:ABC transporter permease [Candidatus Microgenomates bacterium]|nr:ABC transporter permease [Candidatus Microgenomates bacterium]